MPNLELKNKSDEVVHSEVFQATGKPLPRILEKEGIRYQFEIRTGDTYTYKQF